MSITRINLAFDRDFTRVPNTWARDHRLSRRARGLLLELMSHRPGWVITLEYLVEGGPEGRDAIRTGIAELEECGYLIRERTRGDDGRLGGTNYILNDPWEKPSSEKPTVDNPYVGESPTKKTILSEDHHSEDQEELFAVPANRVDPEPKARKKRSVPLPDDWAPTAQHTETARAAGLDIGAEAARFRYYHEAKGSLFASWNAAFAMWLGNQIKWATERTGPASAPYEQPRRPGNVPTHLRTERVSDPFADDDELPYGRP